MGRPPVDPTKKRGVVTTFKLTRDERRELEADAAKQGMNISEYILNCWRKVKG